MKEKVRFLGLDVHAETIAVAVAEPDGEVRSLGTIANREESIRKLVKKLGPSEHLRACYEAGPTGYVLYWQLTQLGVECAVVAPTLVPTKALTLTNGLIGIAGDAMNDVFQEFFLHKLTRATLTILLVQKIGQASGTIWPGQSSVHVCRSVCTTRGKTCIAGNPTNRYLHVWRFADGILDRCYGIELPSGIGAWPRIGAPPRQCLGQVACHVRFHIPLLYP
jgi:hypothetical protein